MQEKKGIHPSSVGVKGLPSCIPMTPFQLGLVSSIYTLGGLLGALLSGPISNKYGRRLALFSTTVFFVLGPVAETLAPAVPILALGRFLSDIMFGAATVAGPIYVSEIAPPESRDLFGTFTQVMTDVGIPLTQGLGCFESYDSFWRLIIAMACIIGALELLGLLLVPASPKWLAEHHSVGQARQALRWIRRKDAGIEAEIQS